MPTCVRSPDPYQSQVAKVHLSDFSEGVSAIRTVKEEQDDGLRFSSEASGIQKVEGERKMVKLLTLFNKKAGISDEDFYKY